MEKLFEHDEYIGRYSKYILWRETEESVQENKQPDVTTSRSNKDESDYFIVPANDAEYKGCHQTRTPFQMYPEILMDFLDLARRLEMEDDLRSKAELILKYCNRYGLFNIAGYYTITIRKGSYSYHYGAHDFEVVHLTEPGLEALDPGEMDKMLVREFGSHFIPQEWLKDRLFGNREKEDRLKVEFFSNREQEINQRIRQDYKDIEAEMSNMILDNRCCESIYYAAIEIRNLYDKFKYWMDLIDEGIEPEVAVNQASDILTTEPVRLSVGCNGNWHMVWIYSNLISALSVMFIVNIIEKKQRISFCKNDRCGAPYIVKKDSKVYCSPSCRDATRSRRHYNKKKVNIESSS